MKCVSQTEEQLYAKVRGAFVSRGTSLATWCRENDVDRLAARNALLCKWYGPKSKALRARISIAAGVEFKESSGVAE